MGSSGGHDSDRAPEDAVTPQQRLEGHLLGRALLSGVIITVLAALLVSNLPASQLRRDALPVVEPLLDATGLAQSWNLFAPDPRKSTLRLVARMTYADGSTLEWRQPESGPVLGPYRLYRWQKLADNLMQGNRPDLWPVMAAWLADNHRADGERPVEVVLVKQAYRAPAPGSGDRRRPGWREDFLHRSTFSSGDGA